MLSTARRPASLVLRGSLVPILLCALWGCHGVEQPSPHPDFVFHHELEDFPYPASFRFIEGAKYAPPELAGTSFTSWTGRYRGPERPATHVTFFIEELTARGWKTGPIIESPDGNVTLEFTRGEEAANIELQRIFDSELASFGCELRARIRPRSPDEITVEENISWIRSGQQRLQARRGITGEESTLIGPRPRVEPGDHEKAGVDAGSHVIPTRARTPLRPPAHSADRRYSVEGSAPAVENTTSGFHYE